MKKLFSIFILSMFVLSANAEVGGTVTRSISTDSVEITTTKAGDTSDGRVYKGSSAVYSTQEDFLKSEGLTCEVATDGCNTVQIWNGKAGAATLMYCEDIYGEGKQEKWSCLKETGKLSQNDQSLYNSIQAKLSISQNNQIKSFVKAYKGALEKLPNEKQSSAHEKAREKIDTMIFDLIMKYPQDTTLPKQANLQYQILTMIKFELEILK